MQEIIDFYGTDLIVIINSDLIKWVALKPICDAIGVNWPSQYKKIKEDPRFSCCDITTTGSDGKRYEMVCLPINQINGWLFNINANRVHPNCRYRLLTYQKECQEVLFRHFMPKGGTDEELRMSVNNIAQDVKELQMKYDRLENFIEPFMEKYASAAGTMLEAHKGIKGLKN